MPKTDIAKFNSIKDVPEELIQARSKDKKTLVLVDGTKVSDTLIAAAKSKPKAKEPREAAPAFPTVTEVLEAIVNHPDFENAVKAVARKAAADVFEERQKAV